MQFDHDQVRVTRLVIAPGASLPVSAGVSEPALLVTLLDGSLSPTMSGASEFLRAGATRELRNSGSKPAEFLRFDFKTPPMTPEALDRIRKSHAPHHKGN